MSECFCLNIITHKTDVETVLSSSMLLQHVYQEYFGHIVSALKLIELDHQNLLYPRQRLFCFSFLCLLDELNLTLPFLEDLCNNGLEPP